MQNLARNLLIWYREHKRILPWRDVNNPYYTWLSEIMLQQTRVEAVKRYYARFLGTFASIEELAKADEDVYLKLWEGLGYYSRVRNLHKGAVQIMEEFGGEMPNSYDEIIRIAGIGPYTAAAIASISFKQKIPAIDGNLLRIFSRLTKSELDIKSGKAKKEAFAFFMQVMDNMEYDTPLMEGWENPYGDLNQALMDLGATICLPNGIPNCVDCPIRESCMARLTDTVTEYPILQKKKDRKIEERTVLIIRDRGRIALSKRKSAGLLARMYEFPNVEGHLSADAAIRTVKELGFSPLHLKELGKSKHIFSHIEWHMIGYEMLCDELSPGDYPDSSQVDMFLAQISDIENTYSIPSAFQFYRKQI